MQKLIILFLLSVVIVFISSNSTLSQCNAGESTVQIIIETDNWGEELYWELVPSGQTCGSAPVLFSGGNMFVGCDGSGGGASGGFIYDDNSIYMSENICLETGIQLDLIHVDSYGDGGSNFSVIIDGNLVDTFEGSGFGDIFTFSVIVPDLIAHDIPCDAVEVAVDGTSLTISSIGATSGYFEVSPPVLGCDNPGGWCEGEATNSVWAKFTIEEAVRYKVNLCNVGTDFDTQIAVWTVLECGNWDTFTLQGANDDTSCTDANVYSSACYTPCLDIGTEVYIQIDGWYGDYGQVVLTVAPSIDVPEIVAVVDDISCALETNFNPDGSIAMYVYNDGLGWDATWTGPFGYNGSGTTISGLLPGIYTVDMTSSCPSETYHNSFIINNPEQLVLDAIVTTYCDFGSSGSIDLVVTGGTSGFEYFWEGPEGYTWDEQDIQSVESGSYYLEVVDSQGCVANIDVEIPYVGISPFSLGADFELCSGDIHFFFGPVGSYSYEWQDGSIGQLFVLETEPDIMTTAVVGVTVINEYGCESTDAVVITVVDCTLSNIENEFDYGWTIAPNPIIDRATLILDGIKENCVCQVRDMRGRKIQSFSVLHNSVWDVSDLDSGMYVIEIVDERGDIIWRSNAVIQ